MKNAIILKGKDPWMLAEDIPDIDFQFAQLWLSSFVNDLERTTGINYKKALSIHTGYNLKFYYGEKDADDFAKRVLSLLIKNPKFGQSINNNIRKYADQLKQMSSRISPQYLSSLSNKQLARFYTELDELHTTLYTYGWLPNAVDMFHGNFTNYLKSILRLKVTEDEVNPVLVTLSVAPEKSVIQEEHESFLHLVSLRKDKEKLASALHKHLEKYFYLKYLWIGKDGVYDEAYYRSEIKKFKEDPLELLRKEDRAFKQTLQERKKLIRSLKLTAKEVALFDVYAEFAVTKLYRRDAQIFWSYQMSNMFDELAKRLKITKIMARFMLPKEVAKALEKGLTPVFRKELLARTKFCVYYTSKNVDIIVTGKEAKQIEKKAIGFKQSEEVNELQGQTACVGKAKGRVKIINSSVEMAKMQKGDILVSIATNPDIVPAMKKAAAIVTEQGGITSHAAIVSRELGVPCIIGTKIATKVFHDGDLVEVDATRGVVRKV